jgi:hypothetical protein
MGDKLRILELLKIQRKAGPPPFRVCFVASNDGRPSGERRVFQWGSHGLELCSENPPRPDAESGLIR